MLLNFDYEIRKQVKCSMKKCQAYLYNNKLVFEENENKREGFLQV